MWSLERKSAAISGNQEKGNWKIQKKHDEKPNFENRAVWPHIYFLSLFFFFSFFLSFVFILK